MKPVEPQHLDLHKTIQLDADSCVMCGMCLPACPTYQVYRNESESPRGRISVIQAYAQGRLQPDNEMRLHLEHCLGCMACQAMCPSKVAYGRLIDNAQALLAGDQPKRLKPLAHFLNRVDRSGGLGRYAGILSWYNKTGLQKITRSLLRLYRNPVAASANTILGLAQPAQLQHYYQARVAARGDVALFTGCMGNTFDAETQLHAIKLLTGLGYNLHIPPGQYCCGALHQHHGQPGQAHQLAHKNHTIFGKLPISHIIYTANGCGAQLAQSAMPVPAIDIVSFLLSVTAFTECKFKPLHETVLVHESCSSLNKLMITGRMQQLLQRIPQLRVIEPQTTTCCGAGGAHQLLFPELANELLQPRINRIKELQPEYILSDNLGCALHFKQGLRKAGIETEVLHPVTLLARQLG